MICSGVEMLMSPSPLLISSSPSTSPIIVHYPATTLLPSTTNLLISEIQSPPPLIPHCDLHPSLLHPQKRRQSSCLQTPYHRGRLKKKRKKKETENILAKTDNPIAVSKSTQLSLHQASQLRRHRLSRSQNLPISLRLSSNPLLNHLLAITVLAAPRNALPSLPSASPVVDHPPLDSGILSTTSHALHPSLSLATIRPSSLPTRDPPEQTSILATPIHSSPSPKGAGAGINTARAA